MIPRPTTRLLALLELLQARDRISGSELARRLEGEGACAVSVHGRTRAQFYNGPADWTFIGAVKAAVSIPVFANGDVRTTADVRRIREVSGADGVMIGRGAFGRPWLINQMQAAVEGNAIPDDPPPNEKWETALEQYRASLRHYGIDLGRRVVRKHLGWYAENAAAGKALRDALVRTPDPEPLLERLARGDQAVAA